MVMVAATFDVVGTKKAPIGIDVAFLDGTDRESPSPRPRRTLGHVAARDGGRNAAWAGGFGF